MQQVRLAEPETGALVAWAEDVLGSGESVFAQRRQLARRLGAHYAAATGLTEVGFWAPELTIRNIPATDVTLEVLTPLDAVDFSAARQSVVLRRELVPLRATGDYWWGVVAGMRAGTRTQAGAFYQLRYRTLDGAEHLIRDLLAHSLPYGPFAPAELYDMAGLQQRRRDRDHFAGGPRHADGTLGVTPPTTILELHIPTATADGTVAGLTRTYEAIAAKLRAGEPLTPSEQVYVGYDALQPLPVDPTIELREAPPPGAPACTGFFMLTDVVDELAGDVGVTLRKPDTQNWGYDNVVLASSAANPALLETGRPDELVGLAEVLHTFPTGPVQLIFDVVYGHADNQATDLLNSRFFKGPNMYGQDLNHQDPTVRAILLEMQRRRMNAGCDGIRVDGSQDFKYFDPRTGTTEYDDDYLVQMSAVEQDVAGQSRRVVMIFEDGRPWPEEGWETRSTYRDVIARQPEAFQWGPLIFAHNTPMLEGFWRDVWWRVEQICAVGDRWISGCGNHDTLRRGNQVDPARGVNRRLGTTLPEIHHACYDNPAVTLLVHGFLPGIPMDFINATTRTPWGFWRNTDDRYGVKVAAEEIGFLDWQVTAEAFRDPGAFRRTKGFGFTTLADLRDFLQRAAALIAATDHHLEEVAARLQDTWPDTDLRRLVLFARALMEDCHDFCNVGRALPHLDPALVAFDLACREHRRAHRWLTGALGAGDHLTAVDDGQRFACWGVRAAPDGTEVLVAATLEGQDWTFTPEGYGWGVALAAPAAAADGPAWVLPDGAGVLLSRGPA